MTAAQGIDFVPVIYISDGKEVISAGCMFLAT